jgi:hypothetical protein
MIIAYRAWMPGENEQGQFRLLSLINDYVWDSPVVGGVKPRKINNIETEVHGSMNVDPGLGIFTYKNYDGLISEIWDTGLPGIIRGAVQVYGTVRVHERGYRSQYAQILAISNSIECEFVIDRKDIYDAKICGKNAEFVYNKAFFCPYHTDLLKSGIYHFNPLELFELGAFLEAVGNFYQCDIMPDEEIRHIKGWE